MLHNLNPSFVLDLTATPKSNSNIISIVDARELKKENMVKLPVIIYNRRTKSDVLFDALQHKPSWKPNRPVHTFARSFFFRLNPKARTAPRRLSSSEMN